MTPDGAARANPRVGIVSGLTLIAMDRPSQLRIVRPMGTGRIVPGDGPRSALEGPASSERGEANDIHDDCDPNGDRTVRE